MNQETLIDIQNLQVYFPIRSGLFQRQTGVVKAVDDVSLTIHKGETVGLVGESGCGKTTIGRAIVRLNQPNGGKIMYQGQDLLAAKGNELRNLRKDIQIVFQDPYSSLNPRKTVRHLISEVLTVQKGCTPREAGEKVEDLMVQVGLNPVYADRYPHEFSGGQRQRVAIAKALALQPKFIVCDEAVSALDVSIQSQIINLLLDLKEKYGITYLFISHAMNVVEHLSDRVAVMYLGKLMEYAPAEELFSSPAHPYTKALLSAVPLLSGQETRKRIVLEGDVPSASHIPSGCRFHTRCYMADERCRTEEPCMREICPGHFACCHKV